MALLALNGFITTTPPRYSSYFEGQSAESSMGENRMKKARWPVSGGGGDLGGAGAAGTEASEPLQRASVAPARMIPASVRFIWRAACVPPVICSRLMFSSV
eukprot:COSAG03_NODE_137_length_11785_cov_19.757827_13_plen_101_part_00